MTWTLVLTAPSPNLQTVQNREEQLISQRVLDRLEKSAHRNLMKFNKWKCKVLPMVGNNPRHKYMLGAEPVEKQLCREGPGTLVHNTLTISQQRALVAKKLNSFLGRTLPESQGR